MVTVPILKPYLDPLNGPYWPPMGQKNENFQLWARIKIRPSFWRKIWRWMRWWRSRILETLSRPPKWPLLTPYGPKNENFQLWARIKIRPSFWRKIWRWMRWWWSRILKTLSRPPKWPLFAPLYTFIILIRRRNNCTEKRDWSSPVSFLAEARFAFCDRLVCGWIVGGARLSLRDSALCKGC